MKLPSQHHPRPIVKDLTYTEAKHAGIDDQRSIAGAERAEKGGHAPRDECQVVDEEAVCPGPVRRPAGDHPAQGVGDAEDAQEESPLG